MRVTEYDGFNRRDGMGEGSDRSLRRRASRSGMPVRETDADVLHGHGPRLSEPFLEVRRVVIPGDGLDGSERLEKLQHERIRVIAGVKDAVGGVQRMLEPCGQGAAEARQMRVAGDDDPSAHPD